MNNILLCDNCGNAFNTVASLEECEQTNLEREDQGLEPVEFRPPLLLHSCGCTFCGLCMVDMIESAGGEVPEGMSPEEAEEY